MSENNVYARLALYISIACMTSFITEFNGVTTDIAQTMSLYEWLSKIMGIILPGLVAWRAFIDQSISNCEHDHKDNI